MRSGRSPPLTRVLVRDASSQPPPGCNASSDRRCHPRGTLPRAVAAVSDALRPQIATDVPRTSLGTPVRIEVRGEASLPMPSARALRFMRAPPRTRCDDSIRGEATKRVSDVTLTDDVAELRREILT